MDVKVEELAPVEKPTHKEFMELIVKYYSSSQQTITDFASAVWDKCATAYRSRLQQLGVVAGYWKQRYQEQRDQYDQANKAYSTMEKKYNELIEIKDKLTDELVTTREYLKDEGERLRRLSIQYNDLDKKNKELSGQVRTWGSRDNQWHDGYRNAVYKILQTISEYPLTHTSAGISYYAYRTQIYGLINKIIEEDRKKPVPLTYYSVRELVGEIHSRYNSQNALPRS